MATKNKTTTFEALGYAWELIDARSHETRRGNYAEHVATLIPLDAETGERVARIKIGRCERREPYSISFTINGHFPHEGSGMEPSFYVHSSIDLTEKATETLHDAIRPYVMPLLEFPAREERFESYLRSMENIRWDARNVVRRVMTPFDLRNDPELAPENLSEAEKERIRIRVRAILESVATELAEEL